MALALRPARRSPPPKPSTATSTLCFNRRMPDVATSAARQYDVWHEGAHQGDAADELSLAQWHRSALDLAPPLAGRDVLEVGCGVGDFSISLSRAGAHVTGVDFSPRGIELAQQKARHHGQPVANDSFDVVFSCECLEHVAEPRRMLSELHRVLKLCGVLTLTTENYSNAL